MRFVAVDLLCSGERRIIATCSALAIRGDIILGIASRVREIWNLASKSVDENVWSGPVLTPADFAPKKREARSLECLS